MTDETYEEPDYTLVLGKAPTSLQRRMADWIRSAEVGYDPNSAKSKVEAFNEGVRIAVAHRMAYQASTHNREATAIEREERLQARLATNKEREAAKAAKAAEREAAAAAPEEAPAAPAAKPAKATKAARPAKATKATAAAPATAPPATRPAARRAPARRAPAATAAPAATDAPF